MKKDKIFHFSFLISEMIEKWKYKSFSNGNEQDFYHSYYHSKLLRNIPLYIDNCITN